MVVARIIGLSLLTGGLVAGVGLAFLGQSSDAPGMAFVLGCVGAVVGAIAGTAREVVAGRSSS